LNLFVYTIIGLSVTWLLYIGYMYIATRSSEGLPAAPLYPLFPDLQGHTGRALVYCFSPQCGPCRPMSKEVDILAGQGAPVFKLDITQHPEVSRQLGIRATPTLILVEDGAVARMLLGVRTVSVMQRLLDPATR
jgi:thiol-disulfide isomerase/thioredoxin